jgi:hypothetical protein
MTGEELLLAQLRFLKSRFGLNQINIDDQTTNKLAEKYEIPADLYEAFAAYCAEYVFDHDGYLKESGIFGGDDILNGIINKYHSFYRPIADAVEKKLDNQVCLDIYIEPSYLATTTVIIIASIGDGQEILAFKQQFGAQQHVFDQKTLLDTLKDYYDSIFAGVKELVKDKELTGDEIRVVVVEPYSYPKSRRIEVNKLEELVGGPVEAIPFKGNLMVLYNRDAKYLGYDRNRRVFSDQHDGNIHGKFMIAKFVKGHYASCCLL